MKLRYLLVALFVGMVTSLYAQTHKEGIEYYKADQYNNARELLKRNLNNPGTDKALSYYYLGEIEAYQGKTADATKYFNDGIAIDPNCPYNYVGLGALALQNGDIKGAEKLFKEAESKSKKDYTLQMDIARAYYNADPVTYKDKYQKKIENALKKDVENPDIYILQGDILRDEANASGNAKTYGLAAANYEMAMGYDPTSAVAYVKYADMYTKLANPNYEYAIKKLQELLRNNPSSALGQRQLANAYYESNQFDKAAEQYGKYVENPNHFKEDEDQYSLLLFFNGDYQKGYDYASNLVKENPNNSSALQYQFINAAQIDTYKDQLLPMSDNLIRLKKNNANLKFAPATYTIIGITLANANRTDEAVALMNDAIKNYDNNINFYKNIVDIYFTAEDYEKTSDAYKEYLAHLPEPGYNEYLQQAAYAYYGGTQNQNPAYYNTAIEYANKAIALMPDQYRPHKILGDIAIQQAPKDQQLTAAIPEYETAIQLFEANPDPRYNNDVKNIYRYLGITNINSNPAKAKQYLGKYIQIDPNDADINKAYNELK